MPKVSVIVPNYGHAAFLEERLMSIAGQTERDLEIIVLDDASTDNSVELIRTFAAREPRVRHVVVNERNSGSAFAQWRKGIALAQGEWIWIAESDDACDPHLLEQLLALDAANGHRLGLLFARSTIVNEQGGRMGVAPLPPDTGPDPFARDRVEEGPVFVRAELVSRNALPNASAVIFRRKLVQDAGLWQGVPDMQLCGDWLFWCRLAVRTAVGYRSAELNRFRYHQGVTRRHNTLARKRQRLHEEAMVRRELARFAVEQQQEVDALYTAWYDLFPLSALFSSALSDVRLPGTSAVAFRMGFMRHKLLGRLGRRAGR